MKNMTTKEALEILRDNFICETTLSDCNLEYAEALRIAIWELEQKVERAQNEAICTNEEKLEEIYGVVAGFAKETYQHPFFDESKGHQPIRFCFDSTWGRLDSRFNVRVFEEKDHPRDITLKEWFEKNSKHWSDEQWAMINLELEKLNYNREGQ